MLLSFLLERTIMTSQNKHCTWGKDNWVQVLALCPPCCVTLGKSPPLSELQFIIYKMQGPVQMDFKISSTSGHLDSDSVRRQWPSAHLASAPLSSSGSMLVMGEGEPKTGAFNRRTPCPPCLELRSPLQSQKLPKALGWPGSRLATLGKL